MHPLDAESSISSATSAEASSEPQPRHQQQDDGLGGAESSPPSRDTPPAKAHVKTPASSSQCSDRHQQTLAAAAVDVDVVEPIPKRPRRQPAPPTTTSSVDHRQPMIATAVLERFAGDVSLDAVFRRVRLGGGGPDEPGVIAYYTTVTIAGHVFRGVLYDVGPHSDDSGSGSGSSTTTTTAASDTADGGSGSEVSSSLSTARAAGADASCQLDLTLRL